MPSISALISLSALFAPAALGSLLSPEYAKHAPSSKPLFLFLRPGILFPQILTQLPPSSFPSGLSSAIFGSEVFPDHPILNFPAPSVLLYFSPWHLPSSTYYLFGSSLGAEMCVYIHFVFLQYGTALGT